MLTIADIDHHLSRHSHFCLIDWLLARDVLLYPDYEAWRHGQREYLDDALQIDRVGLQALLEGAETHCRALGLCGEDQDFHLWGGDHLQLLHTSRDRQIHRQLARQWLLPQDRPQLDLFTGSAAVVAENHLCDALAGRQFERAGEQLQLLAGHNAEHPRLGHYQDLVNYGRHMLGNARIDPAQLAAELAGLQQEVSPLAREVLGSAARDYLAYAWRRLANNFAGIPFDPATPRLHTSFALTQIPDWPAVRDCLADEPGLPQHPHLLERLALAYSALQQTEKSLLLWCALFERHPDHAEAAMAAQPPVVAGLWQNFWELEDELNEELECAWFSAFILARQPGLVHHLNGSPALTHPASVAMIELIGTRQTDDEIPARQRLKATHPALLRLYQATR